MWNFGERPVFWMWFLPFALLDLVLRGFALWKSAKNEEKWWFLALMVVNSMGILPGIYLLTHQAEVTKKAVKKHGKK